MRFVTIKLSDVSSCPQHNLSPEHWMPEHRTEQCKPELIALARQMKEQIIAKKKDAVNSLNNQYEDYLQSLRKDK